MPALGGLDPAFATILLLGLNGLMPLPRIAVCIPAGAALGWAAIGPTMFGTALGFALGFMLARFSLRRPIERLATKRPAIGAALQALDQEGWRFLAMLRFASPVPGPVINAACGVTRMGFGTFVLVGLVAVLPQTLLFVYLGRAGSRALSSGSPFSFDTLTALAGISLTVMALWRLRVAAQRQSAWIMADANAQAVQPTA